MTTTADFRPSERLRVRWVEIDSDRQVLPHAQSSAVSFNRRAGFEPPIVPHASRSQRRLPLARARKACVAGWSTICRPQRASTLAMRAGSTPSWAIATPPLTDSR